jgi:hypothetical protein
MLAACSSRAAKRTLQKFTQATAIICLWLEQPPGKSQLGWVERSDTHQDMKKGTGYFS